MISYYTYPGLKFKDEIATPMGAFHSPKHIVSVVAKYFDVSVSEITKVGRRRETVFPRQVAMYIIRNETNLTWLAIGNFFNKNHTTVIAAYNYIEGKINTDTSTKRQIEKIISSI